MSTAFPLSLECLQLIIRHLADERDSCSLATLLRVNKYTRSATLPIMYEDPFTLPILSHTSSTTKTLAPIFKLMNTLLLSLPDNKLVTDLMRAAYLSDTAEEHQNQRSSTEPTSAPYYSFNTIIDFDQFSPPNLGIFCNEYFAVCGEFIDYLQWSGQASRYLAEEVAARLKHVRVYDIITRASSRELRRDFTWALCANAEHIQSIVLPISDIDRYLVIVARFKVLSSVVFVLDRDIQPDPSSKQQLTQEEEEILTLQHLDRIRHLESMILFVQEHRRLHPGVLVLGRCAKGEYTSDICPAEYQLRLYQALPPLDKPLSVDFSNWNQFVANVDYTDLSRTRFMHLHVRLAKDGHVMDGLISAGPFLHRCRALESIITGYLGDDAFQWAVDERKQFETDLAAGCTSQRPLVPLRHFVIVGLPSAGGRQMDDVGNTPELVHLVFEVTEIGWAQRTFIPPAEEFEENECGDADGGGGDHSTISTLLQRRPVWTWDWELPKLTSLILNGEFAYRFKFRMLDGTPGLADLSINLNSLSHQHKRHVSFADLLKPGFQHPAMERILARDQERRRKYDQQQLQSLFSPRNDSNIPSDPEDDPDIDVVWREFEFVQALALKNFILFGYWHMESCVLDVLFGKVVPQLENIVMSQCLRHGFADWIVSTSRNLPRLATAVLKMAVSEREVVSAGLEAVVDEIGSTQYHKLIEPPAGRTVATLYRFM
ncbi:hypothetical protein BGZ96_012313 [Linnemannia gamsii]|uniref:F-box domain-containing protein n=1 Tax=Linnemannia gamsii TaxID=64522 RepID=A0ABQ7KAP3_9FUNG|nr:hypothetical protein BGZ96_012313 [Linnemannia gamsii]